MQTHNNVLCECLSNSSSSSIKWNSSFLNCWLQIMWFLWLFSHWIRLISSIFSSHRTSCLILYTRKRELRTLCISFTHTDTLSDACVIEILSSLSSLFHIIFSNFRDYPNIHQISFWTFAHRNKSLKKKEVWGLCIFGCSE